MKPIKIVLFIPKYKERETDFLFSFARLFSQNGAQGSPLPWFLWKFNSYFPKVNVKTIFNVPKNQDKIKVFSVT